MDNATKRALQRIGRVLWAEQKTPEVAADLERLFVEVVEEGFGRAEPAHPGETVAIATNAPKTAALLFDRIWSPPLLTERPPAEVRTYGATELEIMLQLDVLACDVGLDVRERIVEAFAEWLTSQEQAEALQSHPFRILAERLATEFNTAVMPLYLSAQDRDADYKPGGYDVVYSAIRNLGIVDESQLTWEQVLEFRRDEEARRSYRRLLHWLDAGMVGRSRAFIMDEIAQRLDAYEWALRKHSLKAVVGAVETVVDLKFLAGVSAVAGGVALLSAPIAALLTGGGLMVGKLGITLARGLLDLADARRGPDAQIAFVHDLKGKLAGGEPSR